MKLLYSCIIAISMYSRIPVPQIQWTKERMKHALCFFPLVGLIQGLFLALWLWLAEEVFRLSPVMTGLWAAALPLLITGGIHMDGFLDTMDGVCSYGDREKKLEILKDPHLGAFAVIYTFAYMLLYAGASCEFAARAEGSARLLPVLFMTMERAFSGLSVLSFPSAKKDGLAASFAQAAEKKTDRMGMMLWPLATGAVSWLLGGLSWLLAAAVFFVLLLILFVWFYRWSKKQFGGITGDLAGFYLQAGELVCLIAALVLAGWVSNNVGG